LSFFGDIFSGTSNNFNANPNNVQVTGQNLQPQINAGNAAYGQANNGLSTLTSALQAQMQGQGPNLAGAQLNQATNQNIQQGAGLIKSQAGISPALATRNIADQTAAANQGAAGQAAVTRLQGQLGAQGQLGQTLGTQGSLANQNVGIAQNAQAAQNGVAANLAGLGVQQAGQNAAMNQGLIGGAANALSGIAGLADGGEAQPGMFGKSSGWGGAGSSWGFNFVNNKKPGTPMGATQDPTNPNITGANNPLVTSGQATTMPVQAGPDMSAATPMPTMNAAQGGMALPFGPQTMSPMGSRGMAVGGPINFEPGGQVPGEPMYPGRNTEKQDNVPAMLTSKEIVLPLTVTQSENPPQAAAEFVAHIKAKNGEGDFKEALSRSIAGRRKK
jgi:hypothetical protein